MIAEPMTDRASVAVAYVIEVCEQVGFEHRATGCSPSAWTAVAC